MNNSIRRAVAAAAGSAALLGAIVATGPADAGTTGTAEAPARLSRTDFGFKGDVFGTKLLLENVEQRSVKDAYAQQRCTRYTGRSVTKGSQVAVPDNPLIAVSATESRTRTYHSATKKRYGVRGSSTIADVEIGGDLNGQQTPTISIKGLRTTSDAFHGPKGFGHHEGLTFSSFQIAHLDDSVPVPPELQDLLDALGSQTGDVVGQVIDVLASADVPIRIPGLGSIALGRKHGTVGSHYASSESYALKINITATGQRQTLQLGRARTRIGSPTPGGVFRSSVMAMDAYALNDLIHFGNIEQRSIPCEGTRGRVVHHHVDSASVAQGIVVNLTGIDYRYLGRQGRRDRSASGFTASHIDKVEIPAANLVLRDIDAKVSVSHQGIGGKVARTISWDVGRILVNGHEKRVPRPGQQLSFDGGVLEVRAVKSTFYGAELHAVHLVLTDLNAKFDFGWAAAHILPG